MVESWPGEEQFISYIRPSLTLKQLKTLREFYMVQQALAVELQEAKPLGICKTTTYPKNTIMKTELLDVGLKETLL